MCHLYNLQPRLSYFLPRVMGGGFLAWRWGRDTNANRKEKEKSRNKSKLRRVRFKDTSGSSVVLNKEKKRVWFSRFWFSVRRRQTTKRKSSLENTFSTISTMAVESECKFKKQSSLNAVSLPQLIRSKSYDTTTHPTR